MSTGDTVQKAAKTAQTGTSKASYLPEDLISMIVDELVDLEIYNIDEMLSLNKHWFGCVARYNYKALRVKIIINGVSVSAQLLQRRLRDGDNLTLDFSLTTYGSLGVAKKIEEAIVLHEMDMDELSSSGESDAGRDIPILIAPLEMHGDEMKLNSLTVILPLMIETDDVVYHNGKLSCDKLNIVNISNEVLNAAQCLVKHTECTSVYTENVVPTFLSCPRRVANMVTKIDIKFTEGILDLFLSKNELLSFFFNLNYIYPSLYELKVDNVQLLERIGVSDSTEVPVIVEWFNSDALEIGSEDSTALKVLKLHNSCYHDNSPDTVEYLTTNFFEVTLNRVLIVSESNWLASMNFKKLRNAWTDLRALDTSNSTVEGNLLKHFIDARLGVLEEVRAVNCPRVSSAVDEWIADHVPKTELDSTGRRGYEGANDYTLFDVETFLEKCCCVD